MRKGPANSWNMLACNRLIDRRNEERRHEKHLEALATMRAKVDHSSPPDHPHLRAKMKTKKLQEDRAAEIQLENRILLQKMLNIDTKPTQLSGETLSSNRVQPRSMNGEAQRRELDRITSANQAMLARLQGAKPSVDPRSWENEEEDRQALKFRLSQNASRSKSVSLRLPRRPAPSTQELPRLLRGHATSPTRIGDDDWARMTGSELDSKLQELENGDGAARFGGGEGGGGMGGDPDGAD